MSSIPKRVPNNIGSQGGRIVKPVTSGIRLWMPCEPVAALLPTLDRATVCGWFQSPQRRHSHHPPRRRTRSEGVHGCADARHERSHRRVTTRFGLEPAVRDAAGVHVRTDRQVDNALEQRQPAVDLCRARAVPEPGPEDSARLWQGQHTSTAEAALAYARERSNFSDGVETGYTRFTAGMEATITAGATQGRLVVKRTRCGR